MDTVYAIFILGLNAFFPRFPGTSLSVSFPYSVISNGVTTTGTFTGNMGPGAYPRVMYKADLYGLGFYSGRESFDIDLGMNREWANDWGFTMEARYARVIRRRGWLIEPGASFVWLTGHNERLGNIDNNGDTLHVLGMTSEPRFSVPATKYSSGGTFNTDHLKVAYFRGNLLLAPVLTVARMRKKGPLIFWTAGWNFDIQQSSRLRLIQENSDESQSSRLGNIHLPHNGHLGGPFIGMRMGLRHHRKSVQSAGGAKPGPGVTPRSGRH